MKCLIVLTLLFIFCTLYSCKKDSDISSSPSIEGKWKIINDTTYLEGNWSYSGRSSNYIGLPDDYYNFTASGNLYVKKGNEFDTGRYSLPMKNQVTTVYYSLADIHFEPNGLIRGPYQTTFIKDDSLTLTLSGLTPEGEEFEIINLTR